MRRMIAAISASIVTRRGKASSSTAAARAKSGIPPAWRRPRRLILTGAALAVIALIFATRSTPARPPPPGTTVFQVGNQVALRFVHSTGSVHLIPGPGGQVSITEHRSGMTEAIHTAYRQQGNVITVNVNVETGLPYATWVDFDVAVPRGTNANVAVTAGTLSAAGLTGNFALHDTNGSVSATNMSGTVAMQTTSGAISASRVSAQVSAVTDNGTITTNSTRLGGHSLVQAKTGTINFHGSLDPGSEAAFRNTNGAVGVTLARGSSAVVDARTPQGSINSEFPSLRVVSNSDGRVAAGRIGRGAAARLNIETTGGSIDVSRGT
jgi:Putative adhesin